MPLRSPSDAPFVNGPSKRTLLTAALVAVPLFVGTSLAHAAEPSQAPEPVVQAQPTGGPALTLYQNGQTLVVDHRRLTVPAAAGELVTISFDGVASGLMASSAQVLLSPTAGTAQVLQQRYQPPVDEFQMLRAMVGQTITVITRDDDGSEQRRPMTVLRADPSPMVQDKDGILFSLPGRLEFPALPSHLGITPRLSALVSGAPAGKDIETTLRYLTSGLSWGADHVVSLDAQKGHLTLTTWATLTNNSGTVWSDAQVALVAGSVNSGPMVANDMMQKGQMMAMRSEAAPMAPPQAEAMGGYYLYALPKAISLADGETRQIALGTPQDLPATVLYEVHQGVSQHGVWAGERTSAAQMVLKFDTAKNGQPLPGGAMRVYGTTASASASKPEDGRFLGAGSINATPAGQTVRLPLGEAFDVTATQSQTSFRQIAERTTESSYRVVVHNGQKQAVKVDVIGALSGDWTITSESKPHEKDTAGAARWSLALDPGQDVTLTYQVRTQF